MGKTGKWIRNFLTGSGKKDTDKNTINRQNYPSSTPISIPPLTPREKRRWSFRRSSATTPVPPPLESENEQTKHALAVAAATAAAAGAAVAAAQAAAAVVRLTAGAPTRRASAIEQAAAVKIQSIFRSYLARKALTALKGLVKLQALVRGHLVRKQATTTLRCMEALVTVQARARAQWIRMAMAEDSNPNHQIQSNHRKSTQDNRFRQSYQEMDRGMEENIKIVEMDLGESKGGSTIRSRNSYSNHLQTEQADHHRFSTYSAPHRGSYTKQDPRDLSPAPSALTDLSPRAHSGHFEDYSFCTSPAVSKPEYPSYDYSMFPNYMANTESSRAKARSQSVPKSRPDSFDRLPNRRKVSLEGRNVPRAVRMQRSVSGAGPVGQNYQCPWSVKLDRSSVSLKESECGSTSTVLTNTVYCRSLVGFDVHGNRY